MPGQRCCADEPVNQSVSPSRMRQTSAIACLQTVGCNRGVGFADVVSGGNALFN